MWYFVTFIISALFGWGVVKVITTTVCGFIASGFENQDRKWNELRSRM